MEFQRARSHEQREHRRRVILETAESMLAEMPVADLSLNGLSRRVGLAKSNVLRYFESREAVLLDLLDREASAWVEDLDHRLAMSDDPAKTRAAQVAADFADTLGARHMLCDLISERSSVLERNVTSDVALRHKQAESGTVHRIAAVFRRRLPELSDADAVEAARLGTLLAGSAWPHEHPSDALRVAYEADPSVAGQRLGFVGTVTRGMTLMLLGLLVGKTPGVRITV